MPRNPHAGHGTAPNATRDKQFPWGVGERSGNILGLWGQADFQARAGSAVTTWETSPQGSRGVKRGHGQSARTIPVTRWMLKRDHSALLLN